MNIIPCTTWVKKGVAATNPEKIELTTHELEKIIKGTQSELQSDGSDSDAEDDDTTPKCKTKSKLDTSQADEYDFDKYDEESGDVHCNIGNIASFGKHGKDPLVTGDDDDSEKEDDGIKSDDNLVLVGHVEGDASTLEIFVYNEEEGSFYCHHDILLPSFPLCIEWLNFDPADSKPSNLCAIGNMTPIIEVWDLDLIDCLEPAYKLGRKPSKKKNQKRIGHKDAVLDLAWNENYTHVLASGSVDQTVLLWDLENGTPVNKFASFGEKVQSLKFHPTETHQLLTGCADKVVRLFDCRDETITKSWEVSGEVERVLWNYFDSNYCIVSTDNGYMQYFDVRQDDPIWSFQAHTKEVTGLSLSSSCSGLLVTSANDGVIKVWDIINHTDPYLVWEKKSNLGAVQCLASNPDDPFVFIAGGDNKSHNLKVFNFMRITEVRERFENRQTLKSNNHEEMMDVTEDMESMILNNSLNTLCKKKKKKING
ncbi:periodic tryptophan protein 1 homolog isoform X1 [Hylaeus volcanicus]|uniref:periodic tryptophan protein 1 homolog isoform X1 n=1 Tax=Hylaeus volcanicus TaxID=313075 RepID=UPI0023B871C3|nr:periodic tryptophan protein 1 homolog isoform X1 [Hylaeus volcanicus]